MPQHTAGQERDPQTADLAQAAPGRSGASPPLPGDLMALLQVPGLALWQWNVLNNRLDWNESLLRLYGVEAPPSGDQAFLAFVHPEDRERVNAETLFYVSEASSFSHEFRILRPDGEVRHILDRGVVQRGKDGTAVRLLGVNIDLTETRQAQEVAAAAERRAVLASRLAGFVTWEIDAETNQVIYETGLATMFGMAPGQSATSVEDFGACIHPDDFPGAKVALAKAKVPQGQYFAEFRVGSVETGWRWLRGCGESVATPQGLRIIGFNVDITELRHGEEARQLLVEELDHRLKNLFTIAAGMVNMTARTARSSTEMAVALSGRLLALSRAHDLIRSAVKAGVAGGESALLSDLLRAVVEPYLSAGRDRVRLGGASVRCGPKAATSIALVLHELATNAAKYGALSVPEGSLDVTWQVDDEAVTLTWRELDGPVIESPPVRKGFGSQLARLGVTGQLGGAIAHDWRPTGVMISLVVPLEQIAK